MAWHGSPYNFDSFDLGAIGTGEGQQVHGWGLYFAKDRKVSEAYKEVVGTQRQVVVWDGKEYFESEDGDFDWSAGVFSDEKYKYGEAMCYVLDCLSEGMTKKEAIKDLQTSIDSGRIRGKYADEAMKAISILKKGTGGLKNQPTLMQVEIPESQNMLDENKSVCYQPLPVLEALVKIKAISPAVYKSIKLAVENEGDKGREVMHKYFTEYAEYDRGAIDDDAMQACFDETLKVVKDEDTLASAGISDSEYHNFLSGKNIYNMLSRWYGSAVSGYHASVDDDYPVADSLYLGKNVGRKDNCVLLAQLLDE